MDLGPQSREPGAAHWLGRPARAAGRRRSEPGARSPARGASSSLDQTRIGSSSFSLRFACLNTTLGASALPTARSTRNSSAVASAHEGAWWWRYDGSPGSRQATGSAVRGGTGWGENRCLRCDSSSSSSTVSTTYGFGQSRRARLYASLRKPRSRCEKCRSRTPSRRRRSISGSRMAAYLLPDDVRARRLARDHVDQPPAPRGF